jgi:hypothetical protein
MTIPGGLARRIGRPVAKFVGQQLLFGLVCSVLFFAPLGAAFVLAMGTWLAVLLIGHDRELADQAVRFVFGFPVLLFAFGALSLPACVAAVAIARSLRRRQSHPAIEQIQRAMTWLAD